MCVGHELALNKQIKELTHSSGKMISIDLYLFFTFDDTVLAIEGSNLVTNYISNTDSNCNYLLFNLNKRG